MLLGMAYLIWSLPRRFAVCPLLIMTCLMPLGQELVLFGLHLFLFRLLLLVGALRVLCRGEARQLVWTQTDKIFIWWVVVSIVFGTMAKPSIDLFKSRLGEAYNAVGCFFFVRCVVVDLDDVWISVRTLALLCLPVAALMLFENRTGHNLFSIFGGVPELTQIRGGHMRSQAAFRHPILAGTFGATLFPVFVGLWVLRDQATPAGSCSHHGGSRDCGYGFVQWIIDCVNGRLGGVGPVEMETAHATHSMGNGCNHPHTSLGDEGPGLVFVRPVERHFWRGWMAPLLFD